MRAWARGARAPYGAHSLAHGMNPQQAVQTLLTCGPRSFTPRSPLPVWLLTARSDACCQAGGALLGPLGWAYPTLLDLNLSSLTFLTLLDILTIWGTAYKYSHVWSQLKIILRAFVLPTMVPLRHVYYTYHTLLQLTASTRLDYDLPQSL